MEFQTTKKNSLSMMDYFLKFKTLSDNLAAAGGPVSKKDHILQILGGLGVDYNPIVASLTAREDDLHLQSVQSILLTKKQRLQAQETISEGDLVTANAATRLWRFQERKESCRLPSIHCFRPVSTVQTLFLLFLGFLCGLFV